MVYTAHVTGGARSWRSVVKHNGKVVWTLANAVANRDHETNAGPSARQIGHLVCDALNDPDDFARRLRWAISRGRPQHSRLYQWVDGIAKSLVASSHPNPGGGAQPQGGA